MTPRTSGRCLALMAVALLALLLAVLLSLAVGSRAFTPAEVLGALVHGGDGDAAQVVRFLRLPRTAIGLLVGAALAMAGTVLQGLTRNPIADPGILGISQGAAAAVVVAIAFAGVHTLTGYVGFAFAGAGAAGVLVHAVATRGRGGATPVKLALSGAAVNALLVSVTMTILTTRAAALDEFRFWQVGSLTGRDAEVAARVTDVVDGARDGLMTEVGPEQINKADADAVFYASYGTPEKSKEAQITTGGLWKHLRAVTTGHAFRVDDQLWIQGIGYTAAGKILDEIQQRLAVR
ncbi:iron chelate uptake ABC transporter family permease subunit [Streptomyces lydicus]|uniref:iron chelate uptake ABC transporter family permease subunit n=1 Tax=Streptomyces lydicus TaxID=47763 RepID=UPI00378E5BB7